MKPGTSAVPEEQQRYLMYTFYNAGYSGDPNFNWTPIETAINNGFNGIMLAVPWDQIYPTRGGSGNWATLDRQIARIIEMGAKVSLFVAVHRDLDRVDNFWTSEAFARTYKNEVLYKAHAFQFSPAHQPTVDLATDFVRQVAQRYNTQQQQGHILSISVVNSPIMEQEYSSTSMILYQGGENTTVIDYSSPMITGFRTWLAAKYGSIGGLNAAWNRSYANFDQLQPPGLNANSINDAFTGKPGKDWYVYRHKVHKAFVDQTTQAIKSVNSSYKVVNQHGSVFDNFSVFRGTLGFKNYALNTDGVKVNDAPGYPYRFSMDLLRSNISAGKWIMNEIDGIGYARVGVPTYIEQITQSFTHGAKVITFANFADAGGINFARQIVQQIRAQGWLDRPVPEFKPVGEVSVKLSRLVEVGHSEAGVPSQWVQLYNQNGNQPVRITIDEDILDGTPIVTPPPTSTTATVSSLSLVAPLLDCTTGVLTFRTAGGDGTPIEYTAVGLKPWSTSPTATIESSQRIGVAFTLKARQSGVEVSYIFTTNCVSAPPANKPPVLVTAINNQTLTVGQAYSFTVPAATFTDPDGQTLTWAITNLPSGLSFNQVSRVISGTLATAGTYSATLIVTDNGGATAQTSFSITAVVVSNPITPPAPTPAGSLSLVAPTVDCATNILTFRTAGGDGTSIEYMAVGLKPWGALPTTFIEPHMRNGTMFTLKARQSGREITYPYTTTLCVNQPPVLASAVPKQTIVRGTSYSLVIPATTFTDTDGVITTWAVSFLPVGLTYDSATRTIRGTPTVVGSTVAELTVTDNGGGTAKQSITFEIVTPQSTALSLLAPAYDCLTGKLTFRASGGDGTPIEYHSVGIKPWNRDSVAVIDAWMRNGITFTLQARQSGRVVSYAFKSGCAANQSPVLVAGIDKQVTVLSIPYSFVIPAATFTDPDGQVTGWAVENLPVGMIFDAATRTISGTPSLIGANVVTITATDNAGASAQTTFVLQVVGTNNMASPPPSGSLALVAPVLNCATGRLTFRTTGGNGTPVEFFAVGIKSWSTDSVGFVDPWQRDGVTFTLQARQSNQVVTLAFRSSCSSVANRVPVVVTPIVNQTAVLARSYSFVIPATTFTDPDGQVTGWAVENLPVGLTFDAATRTISGTPSLIGPNVVTITATDNGGASAQTTFILQVLGNNSLVIPSLTLIAPGFDCTTGRLTFRTRGGDGTPVEYLAEGLKAWSTDSTAFIESWQRTGVTFTLKARQNGAEVVYSFVTACGATGITPPAPPITTLVVSSPQNRIVYQRNQANQANVFVSGQAPGTATRAEARLVPVVSGQGTLLDWTNLPLGDAKLFATRLTHTAGWYRLDVRAWNGTTPLGQQTVDRVGIGEVFIVAGQSNAHGGFEVRPAANDDRVSCLDYKDDNLNEAALPVRFSHMDIYVTVGPSNPKHIWAEVGDKLTSRLNVPVLFLGAAQSATSSEMWRQSADNSAAYLPDYSPYRRLGATLLHYAARTGVRAVLWHQGEGDQGRSTQSYFENLTAVIDKSRQQSGNGLLPWVMSRASYVQGLTDPNIIGAQNRLISEITQVFPGPETDVLGAAFRLPDNVHFAGQGATRFAELWDQSLSGDFFSRAAPFSIGDSPQITTGYILPNVRQAGQTVSVPYVVSGNPDATSLFSVQLIRDADGSVVTTFGSGRENPMTITLPATLANGSYRVKVVSGNLIALPGRPFRVGPLGSRMAASETPVSGWQTWPNPVEGELTVAIPATVPTARLRAVLSTISGLNQAGAVESTRIENGRMHLTLSGLQTGLYFLHVYDGDRRLQTMKVLKK